MGDALDKAKADKQFDIVLQGIYRQGVTIWAPTLDEALAKLPEPGGDGLWDDLHRVEDTEVVISVYADEDEEKELLDPEDVPCWLTLRKEDFDTLRILFEHGEHRRIDNDPTLESSVQRVYAALDEMERRADA